MKTAILISLAYDRIPEDECRLIWSEIMRVMLGAGFDYDGRLFTMEEATEIAAYEKARQAIDSLESHLDEADRQLHRYLKTFYGFRHEGATDLLTPCPRDIEVEYIQADQK